jgi:hypothetical protein
VLAITQPGICDFSKKIEARVTEPGMSGGEVWQTLDFFGRNIMQ